MLKEIFYKPACVKSKQNMLLSWLARVSAWDGERLPLPLPLELHLRSVLTFSFAFCFIIREVAQRVFYAFHANPLLPMSLPHGLSEFFIADLRLGAYSHFIHEVYNMFLRTKSNQDKFHVVSGDLFFGICIFVENFYMEIFDFFLIFINFFVACLLIYFCFFDQQISGIHFDNTGFSAFFDCLTIAKVCRAERSQPNHSQGNTALFRS